MKYTIYFSFHKKVQWNLLFLLLPISLQANLRLSSDTGLAKSRSSRHVDFRGTAKPEKSLRASLGFVSPACKFCSHLSKTRPSETIHACGDFSVSFAVQFSSNFSAVWRMPALRFEESSYLDEASDIRHRYGPIRTRRRLQTRALLNLGNGHNWPDIGKVSDTVMRAMQGMLPKQTSVDVDESPATATLQRKKKEEAEKFVKAIESEISLWIKTVCSDSDSSPAPAFLRCCV